MCRVTWRNNRRSTMSKDFTASFLLEGMYSRGKTHLAITQYAELVKIERPCLFLTMSELLSELRKVELDPEYFCEVRHRVRYANGFHLFIDDIDKFRVTEFRFEAIFDLINGIYSRKLGLTVTTNYTISEVRRSQIL